MVLGHEITGFFINFHLFVFCETCSNSNFDALRARNAKFTAGEIIECGRDVEFLKKVHSTFHRIPFL